MHVLSCTFSCLRQWIAAEQVKQNVDALLQGADLGLQRDPRDLPPECKNDCLERVVVHQLVLVAVLFRHAVDAHPG